MFNSNAKFDKAKQRQNKNRVPHILCQGIWWIRKKEKKYEGGLVSASNGFLFKNFFNFMGAYLRLWVKLFQTKELEKGEIRLKDNNHRSGQTVFIPMNAKTFRRNWVTEEFCREPTVPLGHICWVIVVCLQGVGWERKKIYNLYLLGIVMKRRSHLAKIDGTQSNKHLYNNNSNKIKNEDHVFIKKGVQQCIKTQI